jgi:predicted MFS family arabinose efflux permease
MRNPHKDVLTVDKEPLRESPARRGPVNGTASAVIRRSAWNALEHRNFKLYFWGSLSSNLGTWMQNTAQILLVYRLTHSVFFVGVVTCAQFSGFLLLGPWAAVAARRFGGKRTLIAAQVASAGIAFYMAALQTMGSLGVRTLIAGAAGLGLIFTFVLPIQTELVPRLVPQSPASTQAAMAMNSVSYNIGRAVAPVLCVLLVVTDGFAAAFAANAVSFLVYLVFLTAVRPRPASLTPERVRAREGVLVAFRQPRVLLLLLMVAAVTFADDPILIQGPVLAGHVLHASNDLPGYFLSALGLGTVLGSFRPTKDPKELNGSRLSQGIAHWLTAQDLGAVDTEGLKERGLLGRAWRRIVRWLCAWVLGMVSPVRDLEGLTASRTSQRAARWLIVLFIAIVVFSLGLWTWLSIAAAFAAGVAALHTGALTQSQLTRHRPEHAASVMALWAMAWAGTKPIASLVDGWLSSHHALWLAAALLAAPALILGLVEITLPENPRNWIKDFGKTRVANWLSPPSPLAAKGTR